MNLVLMLLGMILCTYLSDLGFDGSTWKLYWDWLQVNYKYKKQIIMNKKSTRKRKFDICGY